MPFNLSNLVHPFHRSLSYLASELCCIMFFPPSAYVIFQFSNINDREKREPKSVLVTAQSLKITMLCTTTVNSPPNLFNSVHVRHFYCLFLLVKTCMDSVDSRWAANFSLFLAIIVAVVNHAQILS